MAKNMDNKLASFTDKLMDGIDSDELAWASEGDDLRAIQKVVLRLHQFGSSESKRETSTRVLSNLRKNWDMSSSKSSATWQSSRKRRNTISFAFALAVILVVIAIFPSLSAGDSELTGTGFAQSGDIAPVLLVLMGMAAVAYLIFKRKGNG